MPLWVEVFNCWFYEYAKFPRTLLHNELNQYIIKNFRRKCGKHSTILRKEKFVQRLRRRIISSYSSFQTGNWTTREIKCQISCHSINVVYLLLCNSCEGITNSTTYIGQTANLRRRINDHISEFRTGTSSSNAPNTFLNAAKQIICSKNVLQSICFHDSNKS